MTLRLCPLKSGDLYRVAHIQVAPEQVKFSGSVQEAFAAAEAGIEFHAILKDEHPVGFFKIDTTYSANYPFANLGALGLRAFMIDLPHQGRGIASAAVALLAQYIPTHYAVQDLYLTVNMANPAALRCYLNGGFADPGKVWDKGIAGPQHVLHLPLTIGEEDQHSQPLA